jgi:hypothetical protein
LFYNGTTDEIEPLLIAFAAPLPGQSSFVRWQQYVVASDLSIFIPRGTPLDGGMIFV